VCQTNDHAGIFLARHRSVAGRANGVGSLDAIDALIGVPNPDICGQARRFFASGAGSLGREWKGRALDRCVAAFFLNHPATALQVGIADEGILVERRFLKNVGGIEQFRTPIHRPQRVGDIAGWHMVRPNGIKVRVDEGTDTVTNA